MAVTIIVAVPTKGNLEFDFTNSVITAENTIDDLTAQELCNAIRDAEDELVAESFPKIADMGGKNALGGGTYTGIVIELLNGWKLVSGKISSSFIVKEGTVIETSSGTNIFDTNNNVSQINLATVGGVIAVSGSGVTAQDKLDIADQVWDEQLSGHTTDDSAGDVTSRVLKATEIKHCTITDASATSLSFTTNLTETSNQFWQRGVLLITSGNNTGQIRAILSYNGSTKSVTLKTPLDVAPAQNDTFIILTERKYLTADIEDLIDAVWDETAADHVSIGSTGKSLDDAGAAGNPWSTSVSGNTNTGTFGELVNKTKTWVGWLRSLL